MSSEMAEAPEGAGVDEAPDEVAADIDNSAEVAELRAQLEEAQRKNKYLAEGFVAAKRPHWTEEAQRLHPELAALIGKEGFARIEAPSRRAFQREAERLAEVHAPAIRALKSMKESAAQTIESVRVQAVEDARAEVAAAWGRPAGDSIGAPVRTAEDEKAETLRKLASG